MTQNTKPPQDSPFARWSRLKRDAAREKERGAAAASGPADAAAGTLPGARATVAGAAPATSSVPASTTLSGSASATTTGASPSPIPGTSRDAAGGAPRSEPRADELPPVESLTFDSDFAPYFAPQVHAALKRQALKQLLRDPRFNVMDGLDVYIGDYSQPDPIAPEIVREMVQGRYIFDPPPTRVNAQGHVEDVPPEELTALKEANTATEGDACASSDDATPAIADAASTAPEPAPAQLATSFPENEIPPPVSPSDTPAAKDTSAR